MDYSIQKNICEKYGAHHYPALEDLKIGISKNFKEELYPINGLRHPPEGDTTGWYIWKGEELSSADDFFESIHVIHIFELYPQIIPYLGLPPGWRFLIAPNFEDVWEDATLLDI